MAEESEGRQPHKPRKEEPQERLVFVGPIESPDEAGDVVGKVVGWAGLSEDSYEARFPPVNCWAAAIVVKAYQTWKSLADLTFEGHTFGNRTVKLSLCDAEHVADQLAVIMDVLPDLVKGNSINFSNCAQKFHMNMNYPVNCSFLLFLGAMYADINGLEIEHLNFTNARLKRVEGFRYLKQYYPHLKSVNLSDNEVDLAQAQESVFAGLEIVTDAPEVHEEEESDDEVEHDWNFVIEGLERPNLIAPPQRDRFTIDAFPQVEIHANEFPTNRFIAHFFEICWSPEMKCEQFYHERCTFSLTAVNVPGLSPLDGYSDESTDGITGREVRSHGRSKVRERLRSLFPYGFKANPTAIQCGVLAPCVFSVVVHGVFEHPTGEVLGFHRSFVIVEENAIFAISNDNMMIHRVLLP